MATSTSGAIELTIPVPGSTTPDFLREAVADFVRKRNRPVEITSRPWNLVWQDLIKVALYGTGADVSGIGSTWISSFVNMNALRPFSATEITNLGGEQAYFPSAWQAARVISDSRIWSIPFALDVRVIFYWRDMLDRAGLDGSQAFQTVEQLDETLRRLQASGVPAPWAVITGGTTPDIIYYASSWLWAKGGDFVSPDGKYVVFSSAEARAALRAYYNLYRYMPHDPVPVTEEEVTDLFFNRRVAAIMTGPWLLERERYHRLSTDELSCLGAALPPGPSFIGGAHLGIWAHVNPRLESAAIELIQCLSAPPVQVEYARQTGLLPARLEALRQPPYTTDPRLQIMVKAMENGRSHAGIPSWGLVEERLSTALATIWTDIQQNPQQDLDALIGAQLEPLANRLDLLLSR